MIEHMSEKDTINASEIAEYVFCNRAWWLSRVEGQDSQNWAEMSRGSAVHEVHSRLVRKAQNVKVLAYFLLAFAVGVIIFSLLQLF